MFFYALDVLQHSVQMATRGAVYLSHFSLESEREHAEEVDVQVKFSGLPCKIGHQSTVNLKTLGDFSLLCGLQFVEQQFN